MEFKGRTIFYMDLCETDQRGSCRTTRFDINKTTHDTFAEAMADTHKPTIMEESPRTEIDPPLEDYKVTITRKGEKWGVRWDSTCTQVKVEDAADLLWRFCAMTLRKAKKEGSP